MSAALTSLAFAFAALCAGVMGYAIQRGATCAVAAVDEFVGKRRFTRLTSMVEASVWVAGGLVLAQALHRLPAMPAGYPLTYLTVVGGALLGLGAYVNRACVFGAVARLGSGEWAYIVTPVGFYVGCLSAGHLFALPVQPKLAYGSPVLQASWWLAVPFVGFVLWRLAQPLFTAPASAGPRGIRGRLREALADRVWSPHTATTIIGITFLFMLLTADAWAYTDVLAELARGMAGNLVIGSGLLLALFAGAIAGGLSAGRFRSTRISVAQLAKCFVGGVMMGWGSLLIPGGNDGLILVGMPLLWPYAWVAFATMCVAIGAALVIEKGAMAYARSPG
jgi:toxin CptA